ncbi:hypothetical protein F5144DRAFT_545235 [Chaetomium tenue]|uniref:Uncharacterized protein n=1 Tax=Chaetomium tenue TaxID=1854479 RepID=A0ACB7PH71_9PEZI|nr:hypothetical protein F5144DRAFT_545235 [Chaetomium globosum]
MATTTTPQLSTCCLQASLWEGTPTGSETTLDGVPNPTYIAYPPSTTTTTPQTTPPTTANAILYIHDLLGWTFPNARLAADALARATNATVYLPDFLGGEVIDFDAALAGRFHELDLPGLKARNARAVREPEVLAYARVLRESMLVPGDVEGLRVPVQFLAPELDEVFTPELKLLAFTALQKSGVPFDYQHFPGVTHGCLQRGNADAKGERAAMVRGHHALVAWFKQWLQ